MLTQKRLKELLHYDTNTGVFMWLVDAGKKTKTGDVAGYKYTNPDGKSYLTITVDGASFRAHRLSFFWMNGKFPIDQVDHDDGDGTNNRWDNIQEATPQENQRNRRLQSNNKSGSIGVSWHKQSGKWRAQIRADGKKKHLGLFVNKADAITSRREASIRFGFHANHGAIRPL